MTATTVRPATPADQRRCEEVVRDAFWNVYRPGCFEHLVWHEAVAGHPDVLPWSVLVAARGDAVVGCTLSTRGHVGDTPVVVLGPLATDPAVQRTGVGTALMEAALAAARGAGERGALLFGNPAYYPRFGFRGAEAFAITTAEGDNFPAFMACELVPGGLDGVTGPLAESPLYDVDAAAVEAFDQGFPPREKETRPGQL